MGDLGRGLDCLVRGWGLLRTPGVPPLLLVPVVLSLLIYGGAVAWLLPASLAWIEDGAATLPQFFHDWLGWLVTLLEWLFGALMIIALGWLALLVATILASPFYGRIAALVEARITGKAPQLQRGLLAEVGAALLREWQKALWYLPRLLAVLLLELVPAVNVIAAPVAVLFAAWVMALQFVDFAAENAGVRFPQTRAALGRRKALGMGFGLPVAFGLGIPILNLLVAPAAVAGGTLVWLETRPSKLS